MEGIREILRESDLNPVVDQVIIRVLGDAVLDQAVEAVHAVAERVYSEISELAASGDDRIVRMQIAITDDIELRNAIINKVVEAVGEQASLS